MSEARCGEEGTSEWAAVVVVGRVYARKAIDGGDEVGQERGVSEKAVSVVGRLGRLVGKKSVMKR